MKPVKLPQWIGRIGGLVIICLFPALLAGNGMQSLLQNNGDLFLKFLPLILFAILGYAVAWFKPVVGGPIIIIAGMLILDFHLIQQDLVTGLLYGIPFILVGSIFLIPGAEEKKEHKKAD